MKEYMKKYVVENKERLIEYRKQYYLKNKRRISEMSKQRYKRNPEKAKERARKWRELNPKRLRQLCKKYNKEHRVGMNIIQNNRNRTDLKYNLNKRTRNAIRKSLKGNKKGRHWEDLVDYTLDDLIKHLKKTMSEGYNWQDYLGGKLHIDHIVPISAFDFNKSEHINFKRCWALSNLQLLSAKENNIKRAKLTKPFQPAFKI